MQAGIDGVFVADQNHAGIRMGAQKIDGCPHGDLRTEVAAHGVDGDRDPPDDRERTHGREPGLRWHCAGAFLG